MKSQRYLTRALKAGDRRYAKILGKLGYHAASSARPGQAEAGKKEDEEAAGKPPPAKREPVERSKPVARAGKKPKKPASS